VSRGGKSVEEVREDLLCQQDNNHVPNKRGGAKGGRDRPKDNLLLRQVRSLVIL